MVALVFRVDGIRGDAVDNNSIGWHNKFSMLSKALQPTLVLLELCGFCCSTGEDLYIAALKLMCCNYFD